MPMWLKDLLVYFAFVAFGGIGILGNALNAFVAGYFLLITIGMIMSEGAKIFYLFMGGVLVFLFFVSLSNVFDPMSVEKLSRRGWRFMVEAMSGIIWVVCAILLSAFLPHQSIPGLQKFDLLWASWMIVLWLIFYNAPAACINALLCFKKIRNGMLKSMERIESPRTSNK